MAELPNQILLTAQDFFERTRNNTTQTIAFLPFMPDAGSVWYAYSYTLLHFNIYSNVCILIFVK